MIIKVRHVDEAVGDKLTEGNIEELNRAIELIREVGIYDESYYEYDSHLVRYNRDRIEAEILVK